MLVYPAYRSGKQPGKGALAPSAELAGTAALVDRDRRAARGDGWLTPGRLPPRRTAPHRRAGTAAALREAAELTRTTQDHQRDPRAAVHQWRDDAGAARGAHRSDPPD